MERHNGCEGDGNHAHNTLSAETQRVRIFYPFHPLHGLNLQVIRKGKRGDGAVCVRDPAGKRLKIPAWMLTPDSSGRDRRATSFKQGRASASCVFDRSNAGHHEP